MPIADGMPDWSGLAGSGPVFPDPVSHDHSHSPSDLTPISLEYVKILTFLGITSEEDLKLKSSNNLQKSIVFCMYS